MILLNQGGGERRIHPRLWVVLSLGLGLCQPAPAGQVLNLKYVPDDAEAVIAARVNQLTASPSFQKLVQQNQVFAANLQKVKKETGIDVEDMATLVAGGKTAPGSRPVVAIHTTKDYTAQQILANIQQKSAPLPLGAHTIHQITSEKSFCLVNNRLILFGRAKALRSVLQREGQAALSKHMVAAIGSSDFSSTVTVLFDAKAAKGNFFPIGPLSPAKLGADAVYFSVEFKFAKDVDLIVHIGFGNAQQAQTFANSFGGLISAAKKAGSLPPEKMAFLETLKWSTDVNEFTLQGAMEATILAKGNFFSAPAPSPPVEATQPPSAPAINKSGPFSETITVKPKQTFTYNLTCQAGKEATFTVTPEFDAKLDVSVYFKGAKLDGDEGLRKKFELKWKPAQSGDYVVLIKSTDSLINKCTLNFAQQGVTAGPVVTPSPLPSSGNYALKLTGFLPKGERQTYTVSLKKGTVYSVTMTSKQFKVVLELHDELGVLKAAEAKGADLNARIVFNPPQSGKYRILAGSADSSGEGTFSLEVQY